MRKAVILSTAALAFGLAGCQTVQQQRALHGAVIGGATGAVIGGVATGSSRGLVTGGLVGAGAGAIIGAVTAPAGPCYVRTSSGRYRQVACR